MTEDAGRSLLLGLGAVLGASLSYFVGNALIQGIIRCRDRGREVVREILRIESPAALGPQAPCRPVTFPELPGSDRSRHSRLRPWDPFWR